jgi:hypothetical protein
MKLILGRGKSWCIFSAVSQRFAIQKSNISRVM